LSKLTAADARTIRATYQRGVTGFGLESLARRFSVSVTAVQKVIHGITWKHAV
jgi:hypothetical protein